MAASARVETLAASEVFVMSRPRDAPTRAVEAMLGAVPCRAPRNPRKISARVGLATGFWAGMPAGVELMGASEVIPRRGRGLG